MWCDIEPELYKNTHFCHTTTEKLNGRNDVWWNIQVYSANIDAFAFDIFSIYVYSVALKFFFSYIEKQQGMGPMHTQLKIHRSV